MSKIIDLIHKHQKEHEKDKKPFFSFEYFPPKTDAGVDNLYERLDRMKLVNPLWIDVTWGAGGSTSELTLEICTNSQRLVGLETMMHMTCTNMPRDKLKEGLQKARDAGIRNILALRGDPPRGEEWKQIEGGFGHAVDLVKFIRAEHGDYFGICVAGYPEAHVDATSYEEDLRYLKQKVDAGADLIITQLFYDTNIFLKFVQDCRALGITCPIIPGIMPIHTYAGFDRMTKLCKTFVPQYILDALEPIKNDDAAVKEHAVKLCVQTCQNLIDAGVPGIHFYTLNLEKLVLQVLEGLGLISQEQITQRTLPWSSTQTRRKEKVRPIFWSNRPKSYIHRTASWDDYPNGRWGDSKSPAFGQLDDYHLASVHVSKSFERAQAWGTPSTSQDVFNVFAKYCAGEISKLPWNDSALALETGLIKDELIKLNKNGFLTINSQPRVHGASSSDPKVGWGPKGGYVYQKAYVEFFTSPENLRALVEAAKNFSSIGYNGMNLKGERLTNGFDTPTAVTWGVFPNSEIMQPTVVDPESFTVWKDEAFALWKSLWASLYPEGTPTRQLMDNIINSYFLVSVVDNDLVNGNIFAVFNQVIDNKASTA